MNASGMERFHWWLNVCMTLMFTVGAMALMVGSGFAAGESVLRHKWGNVAWFTVLTVVWLLVGSAMANACRWLLEQKPTSQSAEGDRDE